MKTSCCQTKHFQWADNHTVVCRNADCNHYLLPTSLVAPGKALNRLFLAFFFVFFFIFTYEDYSSTKNQDLLLNDLVFWQAGGPELSPQSLRQEIDRNELICPKEVYAQMMLESGNLESFLTRKTNNLLGMRYPFKRSTTAIGLYLPDKQKIVYGDQKSLLKYRSMNHYAVYRTWLDCVADYKHWQDDCFKLKDRYLTFLGNYYAEDEQYVQKIKSISSH